METPNILAVSLCEVHGSNKRWKKSVSPLKSKFKVASSVVPALRDMVFVESKVEDDELQRSEGSRATRGPSAD